jgi:EAL domain-containing protein (putative c-di-GMP-specific phosphodiesterase class I)
MANAMVDPTVGDVAGAARGVPPFAPELDELDRILRNQLISMVYQPIVSLLDDSVVGYEALARGPVQSPLNEPAAMFGAAAKHGRLKELDIACQTQAIVQAREVLTESGHALFVNVEPEVALDAALGRDTAAQASLENLLHGLERVCPVVLELSDTHSYDSPAQMVHLVAWARSMGFRIAIDDMGIDSPSLSLLPLLEPDVIKLRRSLLSSGPSVGLGRVASIVRAQAERTGAAIVATGIESIRDREFALGLGATHVQGFAIGLPTELTGTPLRIRSLEPVRASYPERATSPFQLVADRGEVRTGPRRVILALARDLEVEAVRQGEASVLATFDRGSGFAGATRRRYEELARSCRFVCAIGTRVPEVPGDGVFGGSVGPGDAIGSEWGLVVLAPHFSAALLGRPVDEVDGERHYKFALSYDRDIATRAARLIVAKLNLGVDFA